MQESQLSLLCSVPATTGSDTSCHSLSRHAARPVCPELPGLYARTSPPLAAMIIHPGFIKTGTTSLQEFLFFAHPQVHALGHPHGSSLDARISNALRRIEGYDSDPEEIRSALAVALEAIPAGRVPVLSDETLTTDPSLTAITAQRLHHHFPQARIVFPIRRKEDMIRSFYGRHGRALRSDAGRVGSEEVSQG